jgi:RNA polymerase sigma-70 factor, ECF subfamily
MIMLNRAIAIGFRDDYQAGRAELETLETISSLAGHYLLPAARADHLRRLDRGYEPQSAYETTVRLAATGGPEQRLLRRHLTELAGPCQM